MSHQYRKKIESIRTRLLSTLNQIVPVIIIGLLFTTSGLALVSRPVQGAVTLNAADLALIGYNSDTASDDVAIIALANIPAGSVIFITDNGWDSTAGNFTNGGGSEATVTWTTPAISAGTIMNSSALPGTQSGAITVLRTFGDQVLIYQTDDNTPSGNPTIIYAFNNRTTQPLTVGQWQQTSPPLNPNSGSNLPAGTTEVTVSGGSGNAFGLLGHLDNMVYTGPMTVADKATLLSRIHTISNWTRSNTAIFDLTPGGAVLPTSIPVIVPTPTPTPTPANESPVAEADSYIAFEDLPLAVAAPGVLGNDTDAEGDPLTASLVSSPSNGNLLLNADGSFTYTPDPGFFGSDSFTYIANDGTSDSNLATVTIETSEFVGRCGGFDAFQLPSTGEYVSPNWIGDAIIVGTGSGETLTGTDQDDLILAFGGKDTIDGLNGDDVICGGGGKDTINGSFGDDRVFGGGGADTLDGSIGEDELSGNGGNDTLTGGIGDDILNGGNGTDDCQGGIGDDIIIKCEGASAAALSETDAEHTKRIQSVFLPVIVR
ncbi:cadherin-like domain-containing protein [Chloroflexi bacterium TSY]|nr:cadherin-like domain-containing protein [Chloroflexi bacterium TSY]